MARHRNVRPHPIRPNRGGTHLLVAPTTNAAGQPTSIVGGFEPGATGHVPFYTLPGAVNAIAGAPGGVVSNVAGTGAGGPGLISGIAPYMKIAVGALGLMVAGVTIVFVAGRKTGVGGAVGGAVGAVAGGPAGAVVGRAVGRGTKNTRKAPTRAPAAARAPARPDVAHDRERARTARLGIVESRARESRAKAETARSEARVSRAYAVEARKARGTKVLNRPKAAPNRSRPKRTTA